MGRVLQDQFSNDEPAKELVDFRPFVAICQIPFRHIAE